MTVRANYFTLFNFRKYSRPSKPLVSKHTDALNFRSFHMIEIKNYRICF